MALLNRFFNTARKKLDGDLENESRERPSKIAKDHVRLLLYKESDWRGRKLLFDSATIDKIKNESVMPRTETGEFPRTVEVVDEFTYKYKGPLADESVLGDMIFGAIAVTYRGASIKIHLLEDPLRIMCSKVFVQSSKTRERRTSSRQSTQPSMSFPTDSSDSLCSKPWSVPRTSTSDTMGWGGSFDRGDSGFNGDRSARSSVSSSGCYFNDSFDKDVSHDDLYSIYGLSHLRKVSLSSNGSWQRRMLRTMSTRFDFGTSSSTNILTMPNIRSNKNSYDSQIYSNSSNSGTNESLTSFSSSGSQRNQTKLGFALLLTFEDRHLLEELLRHSSQLEAILSRSWRVACAQKPTAISALYDVTLNAHEWLEDLLYGAKTSPMWLNLIASVSSRDKLAETLMSDLCFLLHNSDTKDTNFFISTLLSHVLTYHLGWVSSVSPYELFSDAGQFRTLLINKSPYNALWAQLNDLCGNIALPPRHTRTIIYGKNGKVMKKILSVLTYFIRCGRIKKNTFDKPEFKFEKVFKKETNICLNNNDQSMGVSFKSCDNNVKSQLSVNTETKGFKKSSSRTKGLSSMLSSSDLLNEDEGITNTDVVFVLGEDEKLIGLKNKSSDGKNIKKSTKTNECCKTNEINTDSKCCSQQIEHSKPVKHSGFKFDFDKYPQIVTNYMKSKNLEILDRHYIGKPGYLKLDSYHFDPTFVPPIQEEKCDACSMCSMDKMLLQTPTNASELEFMNDMPSQSITPQYAIQKVVDKSEAALDPTPKNFNRIKVDNTLVINPPSFGKEVSDFADNVDTVKDVSVEETEKCDKFADWDRNDYQNTKPEPFIATEFKLPRLSTNSELRKECIGFQYTLLGGITDRYLPDMILQGTSQSPILWESSLRRDLEIAAQVSATQGAPLHSLAIVADTEKWCVNLFRGSPGGMSARVAAMLDALPDMRRARVPPLQCLSFIEAKLRELCVLSKTLADLLMSTDFSDIESLTKTLNIDVNDVPLLMAVATTHTPQIALRFGIAYR